MNAAFVLGELPDDLDPAAALLRLAPKARAAVVVDAGDHARARRVQRLRETLLTTSAAHDAGDVTVHGPCPHRDPCPALVRARDWCHDRAAKPLPERLARFARAVGRDEAAMNLSWLCWSRGPAPSAAPSVVVIGEPLKDKGRVRAPVCGPGGLRFVQALKRHRSAFDAVAALPRGARLPGLPHDGDTAHVDDAAVWISDAAAAGLR